MTNYLDARTESSLQTGPLTARSEKGTVYTKGDNRWDWENNEPGTTGKGYILYDPVTKKYSGKYIKYRGAGLSPIEKDLDDESLANHVWNINNLSFKVEQPRTLNDFWTDFKSGAKSWAKDRGWIKADGGRLMRQGGKIIEVPFEINK